MGNLAISSTALTNNANADPHRETIKPLASASPLFPSLPTSKLKDMNLYEKSSNFNTWAKRAESDPYLDISFNKSPAHLTSCRNYMFSVDDNELLSIFMITSANDIDFKKSFKMPFPANAIACNLNYVGLSYTNLNKKYLKNKKSKATGVSLFRRDMDSVDFDVEKFIELPNPDSFKNPIGELIFYIYRIALLYT